MDQFQAWCDGKTGFPIVDAAMRQLKHCAWMHNRTRMVVSSFLSKDLMIDWRRGERFFMEHLIDGDFASNHGGWDSDPAPAWTLSRTSASSTRCGRVSDSILMESIFAHGCRSCRISKATPSTNPTVGEPGRSRRRMGTPSRLWSMRRVGIGLWLGIRVRFKGEGRREEGKKRRREEG